ncbi:hypothetical protein [Spirosoma gilvum]
MQYNETTAKRVAEKWKVPASTLARWRRNNTIPDSKALGSPVDRAGRRVEEKLVRLIEAGWLKERPVSRLIGSRFNKIHELKKGHNQPDLLRNHVLHLEGFQEVERVKSLLDKLTQELGLLLYFAGLAPADQKHGAAVQNGLRAFLKRDVINGANVRVKMDERQLARYWGFIRGSSAKREDIDHILAELKKLLLLLSA